MCDSFSKHPSAADRNRLLRLARQQAPSPFFRPKLTSPYGNDIAHHRWWHQTGTKHWWLLEPWYGSRHGCKIFLPESAEMGPQPCSNQSSSLNVFRLTSTCTGAGQQPAY